MVPVSLYFKGSIVKLELGIGKGKKLYDKREDLAKKDAERKIMQALKSWGPQKNWNYVALKKYPNIPFRLLARI